MLRNLLTVSATLFGLTAATFASAATLSPGDLIKISSRSDVYYYGPDAKRYVFPNEKTYFTWYSDFSTKTVTDSELAAVQIGGAATYRPGYRMVKVTTDPKVYAISRGGTLRWIETEALAVQLYGADWATKVQDLPDAFFATYKVGTSISKLADYSPADELNANPTIAVDRGLTPPPSSTSTPPTPTTTTMSIGLQLSRDTFRAGDFVTISSTSTHTSGVSKIEIFFDAMLVTSCNANSCSGQMQIPISGTKSSYEVKTISTAVDTTVQTKIIVIPITTGPSSLVKLTLGRTAIKPGQAAEAIVDSDASIAIIRTDIYIDGTSVEACASAIRQCRWSDTLPGGIGTIYDVYGKVTDNLGRTYETDHKTITISNNDSPMATIESGKSMIYVNETVDVTARGSDDNGIVKLEILKDGAVVKSCDGAAPCTFIAGPWTSAGTASYVGRATDGLGMTALSEPVTITITNP